MKRSLRFIWFDLVGDVLWHLDRTRADEVLAVTAVIATAIHYLSGLSFYTVFLLLSALQVAVQWFEPRKAWDAFKRLTGQETTNGK